MPDQKPTLEYGTPKPGRKSSPVVVILLAMLIVAIIAATLVRWLADHGYIID